MCDQADIGDGWSIAAAEAPGARVTRQDVLDRAAARIEPVPEPLHSGRLIEMKLLLAVAGKTSPTRSRKLSAKQGTAVAYPSAKASRNARMFV